MNHISNIDVLGLGSVSVDFVATVKSWPPEGTKQLLEILSIHDGGLVGTALTAVSRLGGRAAFAGKLGSSKMAKKAISALKKDGVDTRLIINTPNAEPILAFVFTNSHTGGRNIFWTRQGVQYPYPDELPCKQWYKGLGVLLIDNECGKAGIAMAEIAAANNVHIVADVEGIGPYTAKTIASCSHLVISEDFAQSYTKKTDIHQMLNSLQISDSQTVIITRGANGCIGLGNEGRFELPAYKVNVIDTTGCGDVFHGAFALSLARKNKVIDAAKFASAAAALCATKKGGRNGIPTKQQLDNFIKENR